MTRNATTTSAESKSAKKQLIALLLMASGLVALALPTVLRQTRPQHAEQGWTDAEKQEFRELQTVLHKTSSKVEQEGAPDKNKIYTRMDTLDALRMDRLDQVVSRDRWLRIIGISLLCAGLLTYFGSRSAGD